MKNRSSSTRDSTPTGRTRPCPHSPITRCNHHTPASTHRSSESTSTAKRFGLQHSLESVSVQLVPTCRFAQFRRSRDPWHTASTTACDGLHEDRTLHILRAGEQLVHVGVASAGLGARAGVPPWRPRSHWPCYLPVRASRPTGRRRRYLHARTPRRGPDSPTISVNQSRRRLHRRTRSLPRSRRSTDTPDPGAPLAEVARLHSFQPVDRVAVHVREDGDRPGSVGRGEGTNRDLAAVRNQYFPGHAVPDTFLAQPIAPIRRTI